MEERKIVLDKAIPKDYSILKLRTLGEEILEIGVIKVRNHNSVSKYIGLVQPEDIYNMKTLHYKDITYDELNAEQLHIVLSRILRMLDTDTIIFLNSNKILELLKSKCEVFGLKIKNNIINGVDILNQIPKDLKSFVCNSLEILTLF